MRRPAIFFIGILSLLLLFAVSLWRKREKIPFGQSEAYEVGAADATASRAAAPGVPSGRAGEGYSAAIIFHGKVIDQTGRPVPNAGVRLSVNQRPGSRSSRSVTTADSEGRFTYDGSGLTLGVVVFKEGYRALDKGEARSIGLFEYGVSAGRKHLSSPDSPTIFKLWKIGPKEPLVRTKEFSTKISRTGKPLVLKLDGKAEHAVEIRYWSDDVQPLVGQRTFKWRCEIKCPHGGIVERTDDLQREAPAAGYLDSSAVEMPAEPSTHWKSFAVKAYFIRFNDDTYGLLKLDIRASGEHFVIYSADYNPRVGSRNLESGD